MSLLVVGSMAFDDVETPAGSVKGAIGGSGVYFSCAAGIFGPVRLVGVVGRDFPEEQISFLAGREVDTRGVVRKDGETFRWAGKYTGAMNEAQTLETRLNVFGDFMPEVPGFFRDSTHLFLANASPRTQACVLDQASGAAVKVADTMNLWIDIEKDALEALIRRIDLLFINDAEIRMLTGKSNLVEAGRSLLGSGLKGVVIKKGEHGVMHVSGTGTTSLPAFPVARVVDPTGAGDSFAGGFMGFLAAAGDLSDRTVRLALANATVTASFNVEDFSHARLSKVTRQELDSRLDVYRAMLSF